MSILLGLAACTGAAVLDAPPDAGPGEAPDAALAEHDDAGPLDAGDETVPFDAGEVTPDAGSVAPPDAGPEPLDAGFEPSPAASCPVDEMDDIYSGFLPTNPYGAWVPDADACVSGRHDALVVLGCPNEDDGRPASCQVDRVGIAVALRNAGFGDHVIVSGAAVANQWVEADTLADLLLARGVPAEHIHREPRARHTDENIYYSARIMEAHGWASAVVVSQDPGQLIMTAVCDSNCCVNLGRLTVFDFDVGGSTERLGHFARFPWARTVDESECRQIERTVKLMCTKQASRLACAADFQIAP